MTPAEISAALKRQFGDKIKAEKLDGTDPHIVIARSRISLQRAGQSDQQYQ